MITALQVFDDFLEDANEVRELALRLNDFKPQEYLGHTYMGIGVDYKPDLRRDIEQALGRTICPELSFFRLGLADDKTTSFIHADTSVKAKYAGILYLSEPTGPMQGTAFWKNKVLNAHKTPEVDDMDYAIWINENKDTINSQSNNQALWDQTGLIGMKFNRFAVYPTSYFHSRWPRDTWGQKNEEGRLVWVVFFN